MALMTAESVEADGGAALNETAQPPPAVPPRAPAKTAKHRNREHTVRFGSREESVLTTMYRHKHEKYFHLGRDRLKTVLKSVGEWREDFEEIAENCSCNGCVRSDMPAADRGSPRQGPQAPRPLSYLYIDTIPRPTSSNLRRLNEHLTLATPVTELRDVHVVHGELYREVPHALK